MRLLFALALGLVMQPLLAVGAEYTVSYDLEKKKIDVEGCFERIPSRLITSDSAANNMIEEIKWKNSASGQQLSIIQNMGRKHIDLRNSKGPGCINYRVDYAKQRGRLNNARLQEQHPEDVLAKISNWLWLPQNLKEFPVTVTFRHPASHAISAPWQLLERSQTSTRYQVPDLPNDWSGYVAFGRFQVTTISIGDAQLRIALMGGIYDIDRTMYVDWVESMAQSVANIGGDFPVKSAQIIVYAIDGYNGAVPWGQVNRGGGSSVMFFVNAHVDKQTLYDDWTAAHEFSHLLLPYTPYDRWLSEGFASYHQNITRARAGLLDEKTAWHKLLSGFERGRQSASKPGAPYVEDAGRSHNMQMYWGGAVLALLIEIELYKQTQGQLSLSTTLARVEECCLESSKEWRARQVLEKLDEISGTNAFTKTYQQYIYRNTYPKFDQALKDLGVKQTSSGLQFEDQAPLAPLRQHIMHGKP